MSPEQARGEELDARSDLFSFGLVLYEMATGRRAFPGESPGLVFDGILNRTPAAPRISNPDLPAKLEEIINKALEKDRKLRYQNASDLRADLQRLKRDTESARVSAAGPSAVLRVHPWWRRKTALAAGGLALAALLAVGTWFAVFRARGEAIDSVAVLPFVNASADASLDYLSDGVTDGIINSLARLPNLRTIARTSVFRYKGRDIDPKRVASELGVRAVVTGRVIQRGNQLSISAELVDTREDRQLWGEQYNRKLADLAGVQGEIASEVSDKLRLRLSDQAKGQLARHYTPDPEAYQLYLKGRYFWNTSTPEALKKSVEHFQQAIEKDPGYALAYAGLAECYNDLGALSFAAPKETFPKAKAAAMKALEIDDNLAEAHTALGWAEWNWDWDKTAAEREFRRAVELNPNSSVAHHRYGIFLNHLGRFDEGVAEGMRARVLDPLSPIITAFLAYDYLVARRYDEAMSELRKALAFDPNSAFNRESIAWIYALQRMYPQALAACEKIPKEALTVTAENQGPVLSLAWVYAVAGRRAAAESLVDAFKKLSSQEYIDPYGIALALKEHTESHGC